MRTGNEVLEEIVDLGFNAILHHIDQTDYPQKVVDEIRPLWEKFDILNSNPNMTNALRKFVRACDDHKPEETLGNLMVRITIEPSILSSLKKVSSYEWKAHESFSSSALQQLTQMQIVFGYCELVANNLTSINDSSSKEMFEVKLKKTAVAIHQSGDELKENFLLHGATFVVRSRIDKDGVESDEGNRCIVQTMKERYQWTNFNLCKENPQFACHADCLAKTKIDYNSDNKYIITDLSRLDKCPPESPNFLPNGCCWSDNNTVAALDDYSPYTNVLQEKQRQSYPLYSKTRKPKTKRVKKHPYFRIEISYPDLLNGDSLIASFYTKKNYKKY